MDENNNVTNDEVKAEEVSNVENNEVKTDVVNVDASVLTNEEIKNISEGSNPLFKAFLNNSLIYYSTTLKYKDFKKYKKILKEKDCFSHLKGKSLKHKIRNFMIKSNAYFYYNYIMRLR